jgi:hypothetical protein
MDFQISALNIDDFSHLFGQDHETLSKLGVQRIVADSNTGFPCRVSLQDAKVGENLLLMNYEHQPMPTPFRSSHAIYVREGSIPARPEKNEVAEMFRHRFLSVRAFDAAGMIIDADVIDGVSLESLIERMFANESVDYLHVHNAKLGCYVALVERA